MFRKLMPDALQHCNEKVSIGGRTLTTLRPPNDIDTLDEDEQTIEALVSLDKS